jgi:hypothetical protein
MTVNFPAAKIASILHEARWTTLARAFRSSMMANGRIGLDSGGYAGPTIDIMKAPY